MQIFRNYRVSRGVHMGTTLAGLQHSCNLQFVRLQFTVCPSALFDLTDKDQGVPQPGEWGAS